MSRPWSRSLLSLLMLWQLVASALAHPLDTPNGTSMDGATMKMEVAVGGVMLNETHEAHGDCHDAAMSMMSPEEHPSVHHEDAAQANTQQSLVDHPCHSACKCPCAGTPALAFVLPVIAPAMPDPPVVVIPSLERLSPVLANLLRPPISNSVPA